MIEELGRDGHERLLSTLQHLGADGMTLSAENVRLTLEGAADRGFAFEGAWASALNRLQPSQLGGFADARLAEELLLDRGILEEIRPAFESAYEERRQALRGRGSELPASPRTPRRSRPTSRTR